MKTKIKYFTSPNWRFPRSNFQVTQKTHLIRQVFGPQENEYIFSFKNREDLEDFLKENTSVKCLETRFVIKYDQDPNRQNFPSILISRSSLEQLELLNEDYRLRNEVIGKCERNQDGLFENDHEKSIYMDYILTGKPKIPTIEDATRSLLQKKEELLRN